MAKPPVRKHHKLRLHMQMSLNDAVQALSLPDSRVYAFLLQLVKAAEIREPRSALTRLLDLDDMGIYGGQIEDACIELCNGNLNKFLTLLADRDPSLDRYKQVEPVEVPKPVATQPPKPPAITAHEVMKGASTTGENVVEIEQLHNEYLAWLGDKTSTKRKAREFLQQRSRGVAA